VPAGDIGVGGREIGFLFGQYKRLANEFTGVLTGKGLDWGGSCVRTEATGYGIAYFAQQMLKTRGQGFEGKTVAVSGFGNVAWGAVTKATQLGARVVTISGPDGYVYDGDGVKGEKIEYMLDMRASRRDKAQDYADKFGARFVAGRRPWEVKVDIALPCATQNELDQADAEMLLKNGCACVAEGANMPCTPEAQHVFLQSRILYSPGKASNAGGVAVSGLEMAQNRAGLAWSCEDVESRLRQIMSMIHEQCVEHGRDSEEYVNYVKGANIAGFVKVADAMLAQGVV